MAITITIQGKDIEFPASGASPNWAPAIIQFAQAVEAALGSVTGVYDVAPQVQNIDAQNPGSNVDITALKFSSIDVVAVNILYGVVRSTDTNDIAEGGKISLVYNEGNSPGNKWEITRHYAGDGLITFSVTDTGQVRFTTTTLAGINHAGFITFRADSVATT